MGGLIPDEDCIRKLRGAINYVSVLNKTSKYYLKLIIDSCISQMLW
jgi:hypothetical protein